jgi:pyruvate dehydrogenase E1 component alpha subunit
MLADTIPVAVGVGLTYKMRKQNNVVLCYFGDGATSRGDWHEGLNLASVQKAPVIYICNNNLYAYSTPLEKQMAIKDIAIRAQSLQHAGRDGEWQ